MSSPYSGLDESQWKFRTESLIKKHPLSQKYIKKIVLDSWDCILNTVVGKYKIGIDIFPKPQIMGFFLHELICLEISHLDPKIWRCEKEVNDKDVVNMKNRIFSIEVKTSSHPSRIFGNRSYAQVTENHKKSKSGYCLAINFTKFESDNIQPKIKLIRFGWLDHDDWVGQKSQSGQQARLSASAEKYKLLTIN